MEKPVDVRLKEMLDVYKELDKHHINEYNCLGKYFNKKFLNLGQTVICQLCNSNVKWNDIYNVFLKYINKKKSIYINKPQINFL